MPTALGWLPAMSSKAISSCRSAVGTKTGYHWHHIVEQRHATRFGATQIHSTNNLIAIPARVHQACVNKWMATKNVNRFGIRSGSQTMRTYVGGLSYQRQHSIGVALLRYCGVLV